MSGRDERMPQERPLCPICGQNRDILLNYENGDEAGWILMDIDAKTFGITVILNEDYDPVLRIVSCECEDCGLLDIEFAVIAYRYFKRQIEAGNYMTWDKFLEVRNF